MIGANISEADWLAAKRAEVRDLAGDGAGHGYDDMMEARRVEQLLARAQRVAQPDYAALGISDPEGQN